MPPDAPIVAPPPSAAAQPPPPPVAPPAPAGDEKTPHKDVPELMRLLMADVTEEDAGKPKEKTDDAPKPTAADAPPPAAAEPDKPIKVRKPKVERPALPIDVAPAARQSAPPAPAAAPDDAKKFEAELEEGERETLDDARFLEKRFPDKYKGFAAKTEKFLRDHRAMVKQADFDDQSPEYQTWLTQNQPKLTRSEIRTIEEARIGDSVREESNKRIADVEHRSYVRDEEPKIEALGHQVYAELANTQLPDDVSKVLKDAIAAAGGDPQKGYAKAIETHKLELETAQSILTAAAEDLKEFERITRQHPDT